MNKKTNKKSIVTKVVSGVATTIALMCVCLSLAMWNAFNRELTAAETKYMSEVITRIALEVNVELNHYIDTAQGMAQSTAIKDYLLNIEGEVYEGEELEEIPEEVPEIPVVVPEVETETAEVDENAEDAVNAEDSAVSEDSDDSANSENPETVEESEVDVVTEPHAEEVETEVYDTEMIEVATLSQVRTGNIEDIAGYEDALKEIKNVADVLGSNVTYVTIFSLYGNDYVTQHGDTAGDDFQLSSRPYYEAATTKQTYITDPFEEVLTGNSSIAIAEPIFDETGRVIGILTIEMSTEQLSKIITSTTFGETGATLLMDRNNNIIAYPDPALIGVNISALSYSGENADQELANPTGEIQEYKFGDVTRIGGIATISELSGWKMLSAIDSAEFKDTVTVVITRLNIGLVLAVLIATSFCGRSVYRNLRPLKKLEDFMSELAEGNLGATVEYEEQDEIGRLGKHMNDTATSLSGYIQMIDKSLKAFGDGDLTKPEDIAFKGDFNVVGDSLEQCAFLFSKSLDEIKLSLTQMNQGSSQLASGAQVLSSGSAEQASSVEGLNELISDINETIVVTAKNSSSVTRDAQSISDDLVGSNVKMQELVVSVQDIKAMSDEVKRIIKTIEDVAFQTNILSLNASIEAARAGTAGRGFAVVADQVRALSATTAEAAEETTKIINDIATAIGTGTELAQGTSRDLQQVVDNVEVFVEKISNISLSAQGQADAIAEINQGIEKISQVVSQNSAISEESAAASEQLSSQSDQMVGLVEQFKLVHRSEMR